MGICCIDKHFRKHYPKLVFYLWFSVIFHEWKCFCWCCCCSLNGSSVIFVFQVFLQIYHLFNIFICGFIYWQKNFQRKIFIFFLKNRKLLIFLTKSVYYYYYRCCVNSRIFIYFILPGKIGNFFVVETLNIFFEFFHIFFGLALISWSR